MARTAKERPQGKEDEQVQVLSRAEPEHITPKANDPDVVADATRREPKRTAEQRAAAQQSKPKPIEYYRVVRGGRISAAGGRTLMREGKVIDTLNYNPEKLRQQGILLERLEGDLR